MNGAPGVSFHVEPAFATPVLVARLTDVAAMNGALEAAILAQRAASPGITRSNIGGWHSGLDLFDWAGEASHLLARHIIGIANANTVDMAGAGHERGWLVEGWANVLDAGGAHAPHMHPASYWSAVYYVRADPGEGGKLLLHDPRGAMVEMHAPELSFRDVGGERQVDSVPEAGMLLMFPSWLSHSVSPWGGPGQRISIAINLSAPSRQMAG